MAGENPRTIRCGTHAQRFVAVVCGHHLVTDGDHIAGFVEISSDPTNLQAWCDACERVFLNEGSMTEAFLQFNDMKVVCDLCYAKYRVRHSRIEG